MAVDIRFEATVTIGIHITFTRLTANETQNIIYRTECVKFKTFIPKLDIYDTNISISVN